MTKWYTVSSFDKVSRNMFVICMRMLLKKGLTDYTGFSQYSTIQYNTVQYSTIQYNTVQVNLCKHKIASGKFDSSQA